MTRWERLVYQVWRLTDEEYDSWEIAEALGVDEEIVLSVLDELECTSEQWELEGEIEP